MKLLPCFTFNQMADLADLIVSTEAISTFEQFLKKSFDQFSDNDVCKIIQESISLLSDMIDNNDKNVIAAIIRIGFIVEKCCSHNNLFKNFICQLVKKDQLWWLYRFGKTCSSSIFASEIGRYLYHSRNQELIEMAMKDWPKDRLQYLCKSKIIVKY